MFIYLSSFSFIYPFINLFCICLHLSKKYVSENPKALFTYKCTAVSWRNINKAAPKQCCVCLHFFQKLQYTLFVTKMRPSSTAYIFIPFKNCST